MLRYEPGSAAYMISRIASGSSMTSSNWTAHSGGSYQASAGDRSLPPARFETCRASSGPSCPKSGWGS